MLILPSVGATVERIILNESATKAKLFFSDGSTSIVATKSVPGAKVVKKVTKTPSGTSVVKKKVIKKSITESGMPSYRVVKTSSGTMQVPTGHVKSISDPEVASVVERAKRRAELLESQTMDGSQRFAASVQDGTQIEMTT